MLNVGIIGLGTVSIVHTRAVKLSKKAKLKAICDIDESRKKEEPSATFYTDIDEMLSKENLDVVHVCLPHNLHNMAVKKCIDAKVHVLLEKPVSHDYESSAQLSEYASDNKDVKVAVCFQNRLNKTIVELKRILKEKNETVLAIKGDVPWYRPESYYTQKPWRGKEAEAGAGTIINQSIHTLDLLRFIAGSEWIDCKAIIGNLLNYDIEVEDTAVAHFNFENDIKVYFQATNAYYGNDSVGIQVATEDGVYTIKDNKLFDSNWQKLAEDDTLPSSKIYYGPGHQECIERFYQAIIDDTDDYAHLDDANVTMEMVEAIKLSNGKKLIKREEVING